MMQNSTTINQLFSGWGQAQKQLPKNNEVLKSEIINKFSPVPKPEKSFNFSWLFVAVPAMALGLLLIVYLNNYNATSTMTGGGGMAMVSGGAQSGYNLNYEASKSSNSLQSAISTADSVREMFHPQQASPPLSDTREFLKTGYNAQARSRNVEELANRIQTTVRGFDGRVDNSNSSERWGTVSFAVPADKFDNFRNEVKSVIGAKFITEQTTSENLLPQKQNIEQQQNQTQTAIYQLQNDRQLLVDNHVKIVGSINSQISNINKQLAALQSEVTFDPSRQSEIQRQEDQLSKDRSSLTIQLRNENATYNQNISSIDSQIQDQQNNLQSLGQQDTNLLDNVATVEGTISITWISIWEIMGYYIPGFWYWVSLIILIAIIIYIHRRRNQFIIP